MKELDNPGRGDCLFYSLSAGLIHYIQTCPDREQAKALWDKWGVLSGLAESTMKEGLHPITFEEIEELDLSDNPTKETDLKIRLQFSLRKIAAETLIKRSNDLFFSQCNPESEQYQLRQAKINQLNDQLKEYDDVFQQVEILEQPSRLLQAEIKKIRENNGYLETKETLELNTQRLNSLNAIKTEIAFLKLKTMQNSEEISQLRNQRSLLTTNQIEHDPIYINLRNLVDFYKTPRDEDYLSHNIFQYSPVVTDLARDLAKAKASDSEIIQYSLQEKIRPLLIQGVNEIKKRYVWGNAEHAASVLTALGVNSSIQKKGEESVKLDTTFGKEAPIVKLININDGHWVTDLDFLEISLPIRYEPEGLKQFLNASQSQNSNFLSIPKLCTSYPHPRESELLKNQLSHPNLEELFKAARSNNASYIYHFIEESKDIPDSINVCDSQQNTSLLLAAMYGHFRIIRLLIAAGARIDISNIHGDTALIWAATNGHFPVVKALISAGAAINAYNNYGDTALMGAIRQGHLEIVNFLVTNGAIISLMNSKGQDAELEAHDALLKFASINPLDKTREQEAEEQKRFAIMSIIQNTLFLQAAKECNIEVIVWFINLFQTDHRRLNCSDQEGNSALILAAKYGHLSIIKKLLAANADIFHTNWKGQTAADATRIPFIKTLLQRIEFFYAAQLGHIKLIQKYIAINEGNVVSEINITDKQGNTALMIAAENGHSDIVQLLINEGADISRRNYFRCTAKNITHYPVIKQLIQQEKVLKKSLDKMVTHFDDFITIYNSHYGTHLTRSRFKNAHFQLLVLDVLSENNAAFLYHLLSSLFKLTIEADPQTVIEFRDYFLKQLKIIFVRSEVNAAITTRKLACLVENINSAAYEANTTPTEVHTIELFKELDKLLQKHPDDIHLASFLRKSKSQFVQGIRCTGIMKELELRLEYRFKNDRNIRAILDVLQKLDVFLQTKPKDPSLQHFINNSRNQFASIIHHKRPLEPLLGVLEVKLNNEKDHIVSVAKSKSRFFKSTEQQEFNAKPPKFEKNKDICALM